VARGGTEPPGAGQIEYIGEEKARGRERSSRLKVESPEPLGIFDLKAERRRGIPRPDPLGAGAEMTGGKRKGRGAECAEIRKARNRKMMTGPPTPGGFL